MPAALTFFLTLILFTILALIVYNMLNMFILTKYNPNKWIILGIALAILIIPTVINVLNRTTFSGTIWQYVQSSIFIVFALWFFDLTRYGEKKIVKKVTIKAKAKPNRAKTVNKKK
jgi:hypothetical protein